MTRHAFDFLTDSPLWLHIDRDDDLREFSDDELRSELARYRAHVLQEPVKPSKRLSVAFSARQGTQPGENEIKRSVLYFDDVLIPDPVFQITEWTRDRVRLPWNSNASPRRDLVRALRYMREMTPMVRLGRVRFIPSTHPLEPPEKIPLLFPDDAFVDAVPEHLREWFYERVRVRKVVIDDQQQRLVLKEGPDSDTKSIAIDFGQLGRISAQDFMNIVEMTDDRHMRSVSAPPRDKATMDRWVFQSINAAACDFLNDVLADAGTAWRLGASLVTSCDVAAALLGRLRNSPDKEARAALTLDLPMVAAASFAQLEELLESEAAAFDAFRFELRAAAESLAAIEDQATREAEGEKAARRLAREQVNEVDRKLREANRKLKWNIPITTMMLSAGALGFVVGGGLLLPGLITALVGTATVTSAIRDHTSYRALPGYFLWKLKKTVT